jgi:hypothetical protein
MKWILGVTAVAVVIGIVATITVPAQTVTPDVSTLKLFPSETQGIAFVDVAGLRGAPLFNDLILQKLPPLPPHVSEFVAATGFDVKQDVDKVTIGHIGQRDALVIVQARYDKFKVEQFIQDHADHINTQTYLGRVIYTGNPDADHAGGVAFTDNLIIAGSLTGVKAAIDRMAAPALSVVDNTDLMNSIRSIQSGNQVWAAGKFDANMFGNLPAGPAQLGQLGSSLQGGTYQMRIDQDVHGQATGIFNTADMAKATSDTLRGLLAMGKLQVSQNPTLAQLLNGVDVESNGTSLTVNFAASGDLLKQIKDLRDGAKAGLKLGH